MNWIELTTPKQIQDIQESSNSKPCLIYKHSDTCSICQMAKMRIERAWELATYEFTPYFLNVLNHRSVADEAAEVFGVEHESPQVLLIKDAACVYHASHFDIDLEKAEKALFQNES